METKDFKKISLEDFKWLNTPKMWIKTADTLEVTTDYKTDFWLSPVDKVLSNTGHLFGVNIKDDFAFSAITEANYTQLFDQAGLMIYIDETHWLKAGIEYNEEQPMISSVFTNGGASDWATGVYPGDPRKFHLRISKKTGVISVKYTLDGARWSLLRTCPFPKGTCFVGLMCCTPTREGLQVKFSNVAVCKPEEDIVHGN